MVKGLKAALFYAVVLFCVTLVIHLLAGNPNWLSTSIVHAFTGGFGAFAGYGVGHTAGKNESDN